MVFRLVEHWGISPTRAACQLGDHVLSGLASLFLQSHPLVHDPRQAFLSVADDKEVNKRSEHLGIWRAWPAANDKRIRQGTVLAMQRNPTQVQHSQEIRVANLVLQAETHDIELPQRREGLQGIKG